MSPNTSECPSVWMKALRFGLLFSLFGLFVISHHTACSNPVEGEKADEKKAVVDGSVLDRHEVVPDSKVKDSPAEIAREVIEKTKEAEPKELPPKEMPPEVPPVPKVSRPIRDRLCVCTSIYEGTTATSKAKATFIGTKLKEAGVSVIRREFMWHRIEPKKGEFNFKSYDDGVRSAAKHGIRYLAVLGYGVPWATTKTDSDHHFPADDPKDFANFVKKTVAQYKGKIKEWEIWNEPNAGYRFWKSAPAGDPVAYAAMLKEAAKAVKEADPSSAVAFGAPFFHAQVIMGGIPFIKGAFAAQPELASLLDRMTVHPYPRYPPSVAPEYSGGKEIPIWTMLSQTSAFLPQKPLWVTEVGWPVYGKVNDQKQAEYLSRSYLLSFVGGAELVCWFNFADGKNYKEFPPEGAFGLFRYSSNWIKSPPKPKPSYLALKAISTIIGDATDVSDAKTELQLKEGEHGLRFVSPKQTTLALWVESTDKERTLSLPLQENQTHKAFDMTGKEVSLEVKDKTLSVPLSTSPTYIVLGIK